MTLVGTCAVAVWAALVIRDNLIKEQLQSPTNSTECPNSPDTDGAALPSADKRARKKDQNRRAAYNYRRKKMEEKNRMREEEMRLVYSRVCLIGYAEELEGSIMYILNTKTRKILDEGGNPICFLCPICLQSSDSITNLRSHLRIIHSTQTITNPTTSFTSAFSNGEKTAQNSSI